MGSQLNMSTNQRSLADRAAANEMAGSCPSPFDPATITEPAPVSQHPRQFLFGEYHLRMKQCTRKYDWVGNGAKRSYVAVPSNSTVMIADINDIVSANPTNQTNIDRISCRILETTASIYRESNRPSSGTRMRDDIKGTSVANPSTIVFMAQS
jgi:hypothetical protein